MTRVDSPGRPPLTHHLAFRFGLVLALGVAALLLLLGWWNVTTQRSHMIRLTEQAANRCSTLIRSATRDGMLHNDPDRVESVIRTIALSSGVRRVRILNRDGVMRHEAGPSAGEDHLPKSAFQCQICHVRNPVPANLDNDRRMREVEIDGELFLNVVEPIPNEPACSTGACHTHPADRRVLGIIDIELPLAEMNELVHESEVQLGLGLFVTLAALLTLVSWLTWRMVVRPIRELAAATDRLAKGDLGVRVPVRVDDEIGRMTVRWNAMADDLETARAKLQMWGQTLEERVEEKTEELQEAHERMVVVEKMAALGKLAAVVAHEINNPLAGIATYARLLQKKCEVGAGSEHPLDPDNRKALQLVESEARRCGTIVRNLLLFSRTPGARFAPENLAEVIERCVLLVHHKADLQEVEIQTRIDPDVPTVVCDAAQIQQVVLALVMNAVEAMPQGGTLTVTLSVASSGDEVEIEVLDTGVGIPYDAIPHVFEPFYTSKDQGEGVGLGLSVVYGIVERHRGRVTVNSIVDEGTRFCVTLPLTQPARPAEDASGDEGDEA